MSVTMLNALVSASTLQNTSEMECSDVIHNATIWSNDASIRCLAVTGTESCIFNDGHIEYLLGLYCTFKDVVPLGVTLMFLWLILMLIGLATTADVFFGPCLIVMADTMHLSQNVAGVTLLALGNGAPDIFSAISSITTLKDGDAGLAFGALLGAGIFVTAVTAGAIAIVKPFTAMTRPLLKDIVFYLFTIFWAFILMFRQQITLFDSIGFIILYAVYVLITVLSRALYSKGLGSGSKKQGTEAGVDEGPNSVPMGTIRLRTDSDIRPNLTDVYADNLAFTGGPRGPGGSGGAEPAGGRYDQQQRHSDAEAGYDTSLDFPGGLRRVAGAGEAAAAAVKKPRSRRFQELDVNSSPKSSVARKPSTRLEEPMRRVSRVSRANSNTQHSPRVSNAGAENVVSGHKKSEARKTSTASFTGVGRRANYLTRWMLVYGNLENVEHRPRTDSQSSQGDGADGNGPRSRSTSRARSVSVSKQQQKPQPRDRGISDAGRSGTVSSGGSAGSTGPSGGLVRPGYKLSGGLGMDGASAYFQKKEQEKQDKRQQQQQQVQEKQRKISQQRQQQQDEEDNRQHHLYRIESVDEALDDDTVDRLNRLNQQRIDEEKQREREEREREMEQTDAGEVEEADEAPEDQSPIKEFLYSLVPVDLEEFPEMTWYNKAYEIVKAPVLFLLLLTTPSVDYDQPLNGWSRILNSFHCAIAPVFIAIAFKGYAWAIPIAGGGEFPVVVIIFAIGLILGLVVYFTSSDFEPPKYHAAFAFIGFVTAIVWIYTFANEVVNMLESVGAIFQISSTILGLTVLAWANSIGDVISNTVLARQNFPRVAISACFGGPLFNLLLGVGIPFTIKLLGDGNTSMRLEASVVQLVLVVSVSVSLIMSMVYLTVFRYTVGRAYGIMLIALYLAFLVVALLAETGQFPRLGAA